MSMLNGTRKQIFLARVNKSTAGGRWLPTPCVRIVVAHSIKSGCGGKLHSRTTEEHKKAVLRKLAASALSDRQFAIEEGIAFSTLHKWKIRYRHRHPRLRIIHIRDVLSSCRREPLL
jgi:hypothetical protein